MNTWEKDVDFSQRYCMHRYIYVCIQTCSVRACVLHMHSHAHECVRVDMCMREFSQLQSWSSMRVHICQIRMRVHSCQIIDAGRGSASPRMHPVMEYCSQHSSRSPALSLARARAPALPLAHSLSLACSLARSSSRMRAQQGPGTSRLGPCILDIEISDCRLARGV